MGINFYVISKAKGIIHAEGTFLFKRFQCVDTCRKVSFKRALITHH